jgi:hypothetical protein
MVSGHSVGPLRASNHLVADPAHHGRLSTPEDFDVATVGGDHALLPIHDENRVAERVDELREKRMDLVQAEAVCLWIRWLRLSRVS